MQTLRRVLAVLVCLAALVTAVWVCPIVSCAEQLALVTTVNDPLTVRSGPGTGYKALGYAAKGSVVTLLDTSDPNWFKISTGTVEGYSNSAYLRPLTITDDQDFERYMNDQGFPDSYKASLRLLHNMHPAWIFVAKKLNLDFNEAVTGESQPGLSVVGKSYALGSELSYEPSAYNFDTGEHIVYDSGGWVMASRELIAYAMDPRSYLTHDYIFAFMSMSHSESETFQGIANIAKGSFLDAAYPEGKEDSSRFATYSDAILAAARETGVSAYHLTSYILTEQGRNGMELSFGTMSNYPGYYNFLNIGAYKTSSMSARERGAYTAYQQGWNTPYKSILGGAKTLANGYINVGQNNGYLKKFNLVNGKLYTHQYMSNIKAVFSESSKLATAYSDVLDNAYVFEIPVFNNMPAEPCPAPTSNGSNNNVLKSLSVSGQTLTPSFDRYTYGYDLIVDAGVGSVSISAVPYDGTASVSGAGTVSLKEGANTVPVVVTAASGNKRTYTLSIYRQPGAGDPPTPSQEITIQGSYTVGTYITGVAPNTAVADFKQKLGVSGGEVEVRTAAGTVRDGPVATGDRVLINRNGATELTYIVVIYGDVNGDGKVSTLDLFLGQKYILNTAKLTAEQSAACDMNHDGKISTVDLYAGQRHVLGIATIRQ